MRLLLALALALPVSAQTVTRVSVSSTGQEGNGPTTAVTISESGRWVAMQSRATNLVVGDSNGADDVFLHDRNWGTTTRISVATGGSEANGPSAVPSISGSGERIAFESTATNVVAGYGPTQQIYVHDRVAGTTVAASSVPGNDASSECAISLDGQWVVFQSEATNLTGGDTNGTTDVFLAEVATGATTRVSVSTGGTEANGASTRPSVSADGRWVTFVSSASNLVPGDTNGVDDVFLHDTLTGQTTRVSTTSAGVQANGQTVAGTISPDGGYVALASDASNLVFGDTNGARDIFVKVLGSGLVVRVSVSSSGTQASSNSFFPGVSWYGSEVSFHTLASLVPGDTNGQRDVYKHSLDSGLTTLVSATPSGTTASGTSWLADLDTGGRVTVFQSDAPDLVAGDTNGVSDAFVQLQKATWYIDVAGAGSGTGTPGNPYTGIQYAIDRPQTVGGDELLVGAGTYYENVNLRGKSLSIASVSGPDDTVLAGESDSALFTQSGEGPGTEVQGMTLSIRVDAGPDTSAVMCSGSSLSVIDCRVTTSPSPQFPSVMSGISAYSSSLSLLGGVVSNFAVGGEGGGIHAEGSTLVVQDTLFEGNCAEYGGGIFMRDCSAIIERAIVQDTACAPSWGYPLGTAIYAEGQSSTVELIDSTFLRNGGPTLFNQGGVGVVYVEGCALKVSGCYFSQNYMGYGGCITSSAASLDIGDSVFDDNSAYYGGAIKAQGGTLIIDQTSFLGNVASFDSGGAIHASVASASVDGSIFAYNHAGDEEYQGGAVYLGASSVVIRECVFSDNSAAHGGAASLTGSVLIEDCLFSRNRVAAYQYEEPRGGALYLGSGVVRESVFEDNFVDLNYSAGKGSACYGGAVYDRCTVVSSQPNVATTAMWDAVVENCVVRTGSNELGGAATATYSNLQGGFPGIGNIDEDPLFWDPEGGDFHLMPGSPCIDAGDPTSPPDPDGSIADMGAFPFDPDYCPPPTNYCTAGTTGNGCMATISATGTPSLSASSGFNVSVTNVEGQKQGIIFWGLTGKAAPWGGGTSYLCVQAPAKRTGTQDSGGTAGQCDGSFSLDFNAWMAANPGKAPALGEVVYMQAWFRDPPSPKTTSLSDGLRFVVCQ